MTSSLLEHDFGNDSESDNEEFNPTTYDSEDDRPRKPKKSEPKKRVSDDEDDDEEDEPVQKSRKRKEPVEVEDDDDDGDGDDRDEDDEDEEDDEEDDDDAPPRKKPKHRLRNAFIDAEAEVEDTDEEDEMDEDDIADEGHPDDEQDLAVGGETDDRRHRELDQARRRAEEMDAEEQARLLSEKYGRQRKVQSADPGGVPQHLLLPSVDDPSIFEVRCKQGKEHDVVNSIMKRMAERMNTPEALEIISCFAGALKTLEGRIYLEARRQASILKATENVPFCYNNNITLVTLNAMPDLLKVNPPKEIKIGSYVRMLRPMLYANDLAMVYSVDPTASEVTVKLVPRLEPPEEDNGQPKRKRPGNSNSRPPARIANPAEVREKFGRLYFPKGKNSFNIRSEEFINGFLIKTVKFTAVQTENVLPKLEEASLFASATEEGDGKELDLQAIAASIKNSTLMDDFLPGDMVEIFQGEQTGVKGKTLSVHSEIVTLQVTEGDLKGQRIEAPTKTLRKLFREGDAVKVLQNSKYYGESGMVVKIFNDKVTLLTDSNKHEITVFSRDLRVAQDGGAPVGLSKYDLFDMVSLDATTVGCIVKVDRESLSILDQNGRLRQVLPSGITDKLDMKRKAIATDREGSEIHVGDVVQEYSGLQRSGEVKYIHRNFLFLHMRDVVENAGMFIARGPGVNVKSAKNARQIETDFNKLNPAIRNAANSNAMAPPPRNMMRDRIDGREVMVFKGPFKGLKGIIKDSTTSDVRVEFHTKAGLTIFKREQLLIRDSHGDTFRPIGERAPRRPPGSGPGIPGSRVPMGARTPLAAGGGGRTPAWGGGGGGGDGGKTPAWRQGEGGRTPAWRQGDGGRTPGWQPDSGSRTVNPYGSNDGSRTAYGGGDYNSGSKTPAYYGNSAPTPGGWNSHNAQTPGALDAPTPAAHYTAATPAAFDAPTPKNPYAHTPAAFSAPTPAAYAETPGYTAATPAAIGDDDEPRYE